MGQDENLLDPYEAVLADLKARRAEIDQAIAVIERFRSGGRVFQQGSQPKAGSVHEGPTKDNGEAVIPSGTFFGMSIPEAAIKLLGIRKRQLTNQEIADDFASGGLALQSVNVTNTIGSVLNRRFQTNGDIVRVGRGRWGLKEWTPHIRYRQKGPGEDDESSDAELVTDDNLSPEGDLKDAMAEMMK